MPDVSSAPGLCLFDDTRAVSSFQYVPRAPGTVNQRLLISYHLLCIPLHHNRLLDQQPGPFSAGGVPQMHALSCWYQVTYPLILLIKKNYDT